MIKPEKEKGMAECRDEGPRDGMKCGQQFQRSGVPLEAFYS